MLEKWRNRINICNIFGNYVHTLETYFVVAYEGEGEGCKHPLASSNFKGWATTWNNRKLRAALATAGHKCQRFSQRFSQMLPLLLLLLQSERRVIKIYVETGRQSQSLFTLRVFL